jgi:hypothetical protein
MCGIIAFTGSLDVIPILLEGLRRLEYRGYDSAGIATVDDAGIHVRKRSGRIAELARALDDEPLAGVCAGSATPAGPRTDRPPSGMPIRISTRPLILPSSTTV